MTDRRARRLALAVLAATAVVTAAAVVVLVLGRDADQGSDAWGPRGFSEMLAVGAATVGFLVLRRQPKHLVGWMFVTAGLVVAVQALGDEWGLYTLRGGREDLPLGEWGAWTISWMWIPYIALLLCYVVLLFPDGKFATAGTRRFGMLAAPLLLVTTIVNMFAETRIQGYGIPNPAGWLPISQDAAESMLAFTVVTIAGAQVLFIRRLRRARGEEREQMRWFVVGEAFAGFAIAINIVTYLDPPAWVVDATELLGVAGMFVLFACAGIAILKYRLYDVDLVISRSLVFLGMAGFVTLGYIAVVAGVGQLVQRSDEPNHALAVAASVVVALAFHPVRLRLTRLADRLAYGRRAEPYEVLASLSEQLRANRDPESTLEMLAQSLTLGTGAASTTIWLRVLDELRPTACYPPQPDAPTARPVDELRRLPGDHIEAVEHDGELLGAISLTKRYADALPAAEDRLVRDIAAHAGLLLRNLRLTAELQRHVDELRESRQRLVSAQDNERRRIERNLHDGAQQQLVALKVQLGLARHIADDEGATRTGEVIGVLSGELGDAIATLRELAHGIYPPRLAADGLVAALGSQAAKAPVPCEVVGEVGRYGPDVEAAAYFCCLEALQNVSKYASASSVRIELSDDGTLLSFAVVDDGCGFDTGSAAAGIGLTNMRDRVESLGGTLAITSAPGDGTRVAGAIPVPQNDDATTAASVSAHV